MKIEDLLKSPSEWVRTEGPNSKIVLTSRVRFARNLRNFPFPGWAKKPERQKALEVILPAVEQLPEMSTSFGDSMDNVAAIDKQALVERHLISREHAANKLGLAVRGLYGEGTEALGNVFQVSNQTTLGERENDVIERLNKVILQIIEHEENARSTLLEKKPRVVYDQVGRAYGILTNAHTVSSKEALNLLSLLRMGIDLELFPAATRGVVDELFIISQPAHIQKA